MSGDAIYLVGTLAVWLGVTMLMRAKWFGVRRWQAAPGPDKAAATRALTVSLVAGIVLLTAGLLVAQPQGDGWPVPLVWPFMPFPAWGAAACLAVGGWRGAQGFLGIRPDERRTGLVSAALWLAAGVGFLWWHRASGDSIAILRGTIQANPARLLLVAALAFSSVAAMAWTGRRAKERGWGRLVVTHLALLVGSFVFGLPFLWLTVTSFKEDRDMASPTGIVWVPRVQITVPYLDPDDPLYEGDYEGQTVQASVLDQLGDDRVKLDILKPLAMRGLTFEAPRSELREIPKDIPLVTGTLDGRAVKGKVVKEYDDGRRRVAIIEPPAMIGSVVDALPGEFEPFRKVGLRWQNYTDALDFLPVETYKGLVYLKNTMILVVMSVLGTLLSCSIVAFAFSRMRFPGRDALFALLLSTMMLPAAVTLLPQFLIFRYLGWIDTLYPLWVPTFFANAFNVFLLRQFFLGVPMELEDAAKIDGASYLKSFWSVMLPQVKPALAVIAIWTFMGAWNNFMGPLIYVNSPEQMPIAYALQLFQGDRGGEPGMLMAFTTLSMLPVLLLFFFAQRYFIEGVTLTGLGGR